MSNNFTISETVLQRINYMEKILVETKGKSPRILLIVEKIEKIKGAEREQEWECKMIDLLAMLDGAKEEKAEARNREPIDQAIVIGLDIMKQRGCQEIRTGIGDKFDAKQHRVVGKEILSLPENSIVKIVSRGFMVNDICYPAYVIVAKNPGEVVEHKKEPEKEKTLGIRYYCGHKKYVSEGFNKFKDDPFAREWLFQNHDSLLAVLSLNFDSITNRIKALYSKDNRGCPPYDPIALLRSLILMFAFGFTSIRKWSENMKSSPLSAIVCGFDPLNTPAVGTYYFLMQRIEDFEFKKKCDHYKRQHEMRQARSGYRMPKEKPKEPQTKEERHQQGKEVLKKLAENLEAKEGEAISNDQEKLLNEILLEVGVKESAARNLLGNIEKTIFTADGSTLPSGGATNGKPACDCRKQGIYRCEHIRKYSDKDGQWGYDTLEGWVFGYRYYQLICSTGKHDLPLYLSMSSCNTHEGVMFLNSLDRFQKSLSVLFPEMGLGFFAGDAIHDAYACYKYLVKHKILYAIPYAHQPSSCNPFPGTIRITNPASPYYNQEITVNEKGIPLCPGGCPMRHMNKHRCGHHVYGCPVKRPTNCDGMRNVRKVHLDECPFGTLCDPESQWGPYISIKPEDDPRIHPAIPRDSKEYKTLMNARSGCERSNSQKKIHHNLKYTRGRVMSYRFTQAILISLLEHSSSWVRDDLKDRKITKENVFELFA